MHYTTAHLMQIGKDICRTILFYFDIHVMNLDKLILIGNYEEHKVESNSSKKELPSGKVFSEDMKESFRTKIVNELKGKKDLITQGEGSSSGSDECPSEDNLKPSIIKRLLPRLKKNTSKQIKTKDLFDKTFGLNNKQPKKQNEEKKPASDKKPAKKEIQTIQKIPLKVEKIEEKKECLKEEKKEKPKIETADKATQTEAIDFQKAK